jgi:hypothetical protein
LIKLIVAERYSTGIQPKKHAKLKNLHKIIPPNDRPVVSAEKESAPYFKLLSGSLSLALPTNNTIYQCNMTNTPKKMEKGCFY